MDKDLMILFRSTTRGKNSKGGDRLKLYMNQEQAQALAETILSLNAERGVNLDFHTSKKTTEDGTRQFDSTIAFVKATQEKGAGFGGAAGGSKGTFVAPAAKASTAAAVSKLKKV